MSNNFNQLTTNVTGQESSMISTARPTVTPVENIVFTSSLFVFLDFEKWEWTDIRTYV